MTRRPFLVCFEAHAKTGNVWAVRYRGKWHTTAQVYICAPCYTVYKGPKAKQPKAYLAGHGHMVKTPHSIALLPVPEAR